MRLRVEPKRVNVDALAKTRAELLDRAASMPERPDRLGAWLDDFGRLVESCDRQGVSLEDL